MTIRKDQADYHMEIWNDLYAIKEKQAEKHSA